MSKLIEKYSAVFSDKISLQLKPEAQPIFFKPRPVPLAYKQSLEEELMKIQQLDVFEPIETSNWGSPLVIVPKVDGTIRL